MMNKATTRHGPSRLGRIAGQVKGVARMAEDNRYCVDIFMEITSARALAQVGEVVLRSHVETCGSEALAIGTPKEHKQKLDELMDVFTRTGLGVG